MFQKTKRSVLWIPQANAKKYAGIHLIVDFWYCKNIENPKELERILVAAAKKTQNTPLEVSIHKFSPRGITGVVLLAESHIALHFWPEINYLAIDIFTCGQKTLPYQALEYLKKEFKPKKVKIKEIKRGVFGEITYIGRKAPQLGRGPGKPAGFPV